MNQNHIKTDGTTIAYTIIMKTNKTYIQNIFSNSLNRLKSLEQYLLLITDCGRFVRLIPFVGLNCAAIFINFCRAFMTLSEIIKNKVLKTAVGLASCTTVNLFINLKRRFQALKMTTVLRRSIVILSVVTFALYYGFSTSRVAEKPFELETDTILKYNLNAFRNNKPGYHFSLCTRTAVTIFINNIIKVMIKSKFHQILLNEKLTPIKLKEVTETINDSLNSSKRSVNVHLINANNADITKMQAPINFISTSKVPVLTFAQGKLDLGAAWLLAAGRQGRRYANKSAVLSMGLSDSVLKKYEDDPKGRNQLIDSIAQSLSELTGANKSKLSNLIKSDKELSFQAAKDYGFFDEESIPIKKKVTPDAAPKKKMNKKVKVIKKVKKTRKGNA